MATKRYASARYPYLSIGSKVKFVNGAYETDDPELQKLIEGRPYFGVSVFASKGDKPAPVVEEPSVRHGLKGTGDTEAARPQKKK